MTFLLPLDSQNWGCGSRIQVLNSKLFLFYFFEINGLITSLIHKRLQP